MALLGIDEAKNVLSVASNNYAKIQKELDKYNKIFEVYSQASPETQIRAASVMRQAIDEYNGLKRQQEENATRIFQTQQRINSYNKTTPQAAQQEQAKMPQSVMPETEIINPSSTQIKEEIPVIDVATPGVINNNTPTVNVEVTRAVSTPTVTTNTTLPAATGMVNYYQAPKNVVTKANTAARNNGSNITWSNYGPGSIVPTPGTGGLAPLNNTIYTTNRGNNLVNTLNNYVRKGAKYIYNYLRK